MPRRLSTVQEGRIVENRPPTIRCWCSPKYDFLTYAGSGDGNVEMTELATSLARLGLGCGIYSVPDAVELTGVSARRIRGWVKGYAESLRTDPIPGVLLSDFDMVDGPMQLSFQTLLEVRLVSRFRDEGVPWREIRRAARRAAQLLKTRHPFINRRFLTDGRRVFLEMKDDMKDAHLLHLASDQFHFHRLVKPYLRGIEFQQGTPVRWWPLSEKRRVVIDPARCFGRPIGVESGVATSVLARFAECSDVKRAARWYNTSPAEVRDAIAFERRSRVA